MTDANRDIRGRWKKGNDARNTYQRNEYAWLPPGMPREDADAARLTRRALRNAGVPMAVANVIALNFVAAGRILADFHALETAEERRADWSRFQKASAATNVVAMMLDRRRKPRPENGEAEDDGESWAEALRKAREGVE